MIIALEMQKIFTFSTYNLFNRVLKKCESVIASPTPAPASRGQAFAGRGRGSEATPAHPNRGGRSNLVFTIAKIEIAPARPVGLPGRASIPSPEEHEGRRSLAMTSLWFLSTLLKK
jgi:hypothetical protein